MRLGTTHGLYTPLLTRKLVHLGGALLTTLALCLVLERRASAQVHGYERVVNTSSDSSTFGRSVTASCPTGKRLLGGGAQVWSTFDDIGFEHVVLDDITPNATLTALTVTGFEDGLGTDSNWYLIATANCADPLDGLERIAVTSKYDSTFTKSAIVTCPSGKQVVGAGGEITGGLGRVVIDEIRPSSTLDSVVATGYEDVNGTSANWAVTAYAICADAQPGLQRVTATTTTDSGNKWAIAACPAGTVLLGSGGEITGGLGAVTMQRLGPPNKLYPGSLTTALELLLGTSTTWRVDSYAICAPV